MVAELRYEAALDFEVLTTKVPLRSCMRVRHMTASGNNDPVALYKFDATPVELSTSRPIAGITIDARACLLLSGTLVAFKSAAASPDSARAPRTTERDVGQVKQGGSMRLTISSKH